MASIGFIRVFDRTGSQKAKTTLANWAEYLLKFWQLVPLSEKNSPEANPEVVTEKVLPHYWLTCNNAADFTSEFCLNQQLVKVF
jgi:hypothetical protein